MTPVSYTALALLLDRCIGDPRWLPHPVIGIGKWISFVDRHLNSTGESRLALRLKGCVLTLSTLALASFIPLAVLHLLYTYSGWLAAAVNVVLIATTIAWKGLCDAGWRVYRTLARDGVEAARSQVAMIVGRDTSHLSEQEVVRATVETLAENIVDAIVSPVLFACVGGAPLALLYRAANTLDSMVGYKNDKYRDFGWCSARLDDVLNYIPARIAIVLLWLTMWAMKHSPQRAYQTMRRDARKHPSPNSGIPEAMVAGALGVQLGGLNFYGGVASLRATMGEPLRLLEPLDIVRVIHMIHTLCWLLLTLVVAGGILCLRQ